MPRFSQRSLDRLAECHPDLQAVINEVIEHFDCTVIEGHRGQERQERLLEEGKTKAHFGESKHNVLPSRAVDVAPYPIDWSDRERFSLFAGHVLAVAAIQGVPLRWGGDWDRDTQVKDNRFDDLPHFELIDG